MLSGTTAGGTGVACNAVRLASQSTPFLSLPVAWTDGFPGAQHCFWSMSPSLLTRNVPQWGLPLPPVPRNGQQNVTEQTKLRVLALPKPLEREKTAGRHVCNQLCSLLIRDLEVRERSPAEGVSGLCLGIAREPTRGAVLLPWEVESTPVRVAGPLL